MAGDKKPKSPERRRFLSRAAMTAGLVGSYGAFGMVLGRFLYPARPADRAWRFVAEAKRMSIDDSILFRTPGGAFVNITRRRDRGDAEDFVALSSTCPHLGCRVNWDADTGRFVCPCHNGVFDAGGVGSSGPPGEAHQSLPRYSLKLENGLLFIEVRTEPLTAPGGRGRVA